jgi:hypothetical protein
MASMGPVRVDIIPKLQGVIEALDTLGQAFQDVADALLVARDTLTELQDQDDQAEAPPAPDA